MKTADKSAEALGTLLGDMKGQMQGVQKPEGGGGRPTPPPKR